MLNFLKVSATEIFKYLNAVCHKVDRYFKNVKNMGTKTESLYRALLPMVVVSFDDIMQKASFRMLSGRSIKIRLRTEPITNRIPVMIAVRFISSL